MVLGIIVITGPFLLYLLEDDLNLTLASLYGKALLAKLIIAAIMLAIGGYNQTIVHRKALDAAALSPRLSIRRQQQVSTSRSNEESIITSSPFSSSASSVLPDSSPIDIDESRSKSRFSTQTRTLMQKIKMSIKRLLWFSVDLVTSKINGSRKTKRRKKDNPINNRSEANPSVSTWTTLISSFNKSIKI